MSGYSIQIRDEVFRRISKVGQFKTMTKLPIPTLQADKVPVLGVYILDENKTADGDYNAGRPRYVEQTVIGIMVIAESSKPEVLDGMVDEWVVAIEDILLCDPAFLGMRDKTTNQPFIESVGPIGRKTLFPKEGETYYLEARLQMTFQYRVFFEPLAPHMLQRLMITSQAFGADTFHTEIDVGT